MPSAGSAVTYATGRHRRQHNFRLAGESVDDGLWSPMLYPIELHDSRHDGIRTRNLQSDRSNPRLHHRRIFLHLYCVAHSQLACSCSRPNSTPWNSAIVCAAEISTKAPQHRPSLREVPLLFHRQRNYNRAARTKRHIEFQALSAPHTDQGTTNTAEGSNPGLCTGTPRSCRELHH